MFIGINHDIRFFSQTISPLVLDILNNTRGKLVPPTGIDDERSADTGESERALVRQARFLKQLTSRSICVRFIVLEASGDGLPEIERTAAPQQQDIASIAVNDDENGNGATVFRGALLFGARCPQPDTGFFELLRRDFAWRVGQRTVRRLRLRESDNVTNTLCACH